MRNAGSGDRERGFAGTCFGGLRRHARPEKIARLEASDSPLDEPASRVWGEVLGQVVEPDLIGLAASGPGNELTGGRAQRFLSVEDIGRCAHLVRDKRVALRVVTIELKKFGRDVASRLRSARCKFVLDRDVRGAAAKKRGRKRQI